jgi:hypothetical protein
VDVDLADEAERDRVAALHDDGDVEVAVGAGLDEAERGEDEAGGVAGEGVRRVLRAVERVRGVDRRSAPRRRGRSGRSQAEGDLVPSSLVVQLSAK